MAAAEKIEGRWSLFGAGTKWEDAGEEYTKAASNYKMAKAHDKAVAAYKKAIECYGKSESKDMVTPTVKAMSEALMKVDPSAAVKVLEERLIPQLVENGKFRDAGKQMEKVGESLEADDEIDAALEAYEKAAELHGLESGAEATEQRVLIKVGELQGRKGDYLTAARTMERVGEGRAGNSLTRFHAKTHFFDAGILLLAAGDIVAARNAMDRHKGIDFTYETSRECQLLNDLITAVEESKPQDFTEHIFQFDRISKLSPWRTSILLKIKSAIISDTEETAVDLA